MDAVSYAHSAKQAQRIEKFIENPDSNSGVLTQPKVIEAGETVTIKSGRQAILADTVIDGDLVIEAGADVFVPAGAGFNDLDQRINTKLDKDFSSFTDKPAPDGTDNFALQDVGGLLKKLSFSNLMTWIKSFSFGWGQTWQDVTASRSAGVTYTNNTNKPIVVIISCDSTTYTTFTVDGISFISGYVGGTAASTAVYRNPRTIIVPVGSTYSISATSPKWLELR